jgi:hypothetical protein
MRGHAMLSRNVNHEDGDVQRFYDASDGYECVEIFITRLQRRY